MGPLLVLAIVLLAGSVGGKIAQRFHAPGITGNIIIGAFLALTLFRNVPVAQALQPLSTFAISLIAVTAGGQFAFRRLHNSLRRIMYISIGEVVGAVILVSAVLRLSGLPWDIALLLGALAASTAPATTIAIIREQHAKGPFVKTLLASVSIDSSLCILLFAFVQSLLGSYYTHLDVTVGLSDGVRQTLIQLIGSGALGFLLGLTSSRLFDTHRYHNFSVLLVAVLFAHGVSSLIGFSPLLTCLFLGAFLGNSGPHNEEQLKALHPIEPMLYTAFFTLAGVSIHFDYLIQGGFICALYVFARMAGKGLGAYLGALVSKTSERLRTSLPFGFMPQAGVALGLVIILQGDTNIPENVSGYVGTLVLAAVTINELLGPLCTRFALNKAKESNLDKPRLVEFLDEEFILTGMEASDRWDAIEQLTEFYARTHKLNPKQRDQMLNSIVEREREGSTAIGRGAAIPHGLIDSGTAIQGVLGILKEGVDFDAYDKLPIKLIVLIVTPKDHEKRHLEVLSSLSGMISNEQIRTRLLTALDANDAWEVIESEESRNFNYFLDTEEENGDSIKQDQ
jgi:Kef-type K+ transport system membrane component KefB/mannitol/fructose-specific phosphotransferase system IIA component (Ntr-type)